MKNSSVLAAAFAVASASAADVPNGIVQERAASTTGSSTLPTITAKGNAFWNGNDRFYLRGVDYQPGGSSAAIDPLADPSTCMRDIPFFKQLGLNSIRVYTVDNSANHDACMSALAEAGIYLALDVNTPSYSINRDAPGPSYNPTYLQSVFATIDAFAGYSNTLLFFSGNEVINTASNTNTAPYVKAVNRDMKQYIGERGYRNIPVGYSAADVAENQYAMGQYMSCGEPQTQGDFYAINNYEWCDPSSFEISGWNQLVAMYQNYSQPVFMSEYGCIKNTRTFAETNGLYQPDMTGVISGGVVYQYSEESSNPGFGLVNLNGNSVSIIPQQFNDLKQELAKSPAPTGSAGAILDNGPQPCPGPSVNWDIKPFSGSALPAMPSGAVKFLKDGAGKGPGLTGAGSQNAGGASSGTASAGAGSVTATLGSGPTGGSGSSGSSGSSSSSSSAAVASVVVYSDLRPLMVCGAAIFASFFLGTMAL